ncbi:unnamed protein product [Malus baccata var. baccata]
MVPTRASSKGFNHNSQKLHTLLIKTCEVKPIYVANKSFIKEVQPQSKASHTLDQDIVKQNQFMCEAKPIYGANKSFIKGVQPQFSKASHTLDQDSVKQNQFMMPIRASSIEGNHNSQKLHTLLIKICEAKPIYGANKSFVNGGQPQFSKASHTLDPDSVKQNQFMVPTKASSKEFNNNSQKLHTLLIKTV